MPWRTPLTVHSAPGQAAGPVQVQGARTQSNNLKETCGGLCALGSGPDHHGLDAAWDRLQVAISAITLDGLRVVVDGEDLIAPVPQSLVHEVGAVARQIPGDPCHRNPFHGHNWLAAFLMVSMTSTVRTVKRSPGG